METTFVSTTIYLFTFYKTLAEKALEQVADEALHRIADSEDNSIAVIMQHVAGNLASRWTDFLTSDGEKPWRNRDGEFVDANLTRAEILERWNQGWSVCLAELGRLGADDLAQTVFIRQEPHTVVEAALRSLTHTAYHVGQIVDLCRRYRYGEWTSLSVPRGGTSAFNSQPGKYLSGRG